MASAGGAIAAAFGSALCCAGPTVAAAMGTKGVRFRQTVREPNGATSHEGHPLGRHRFGDAVWDVADLGQMDSMIGHPFPPFPSSIPGWRGSREADAQNRFS